LPFFVADQPERQGSSPKTGREGKMQQAKRWSWIVAGLGLAWGMAAMATSADASPQYQLLTTIDVQHSSTNPFGSEGFPFTTYDISFFDPKTQLDYVADRTNATIDVFSAATNTMVGQIAGVPPFQGIQPTPPGQPANNAISGPDGVVVVNGAVGLPNQHQLWVGDGNATLAGFNLGTSLTNPSTIMGTPISLGPAATAKRVDEGAFDPKDNLLVFANNAATPTPFTTLVNAATNAIVAKTVFDGTVQHGMPTPVASGIEQPAWDKNTQSFYVAVDNAGPGGIAQMDITGAVTHFYDFSDPAFLGPGSVCGPTGVAVSNVGGGTQLTIACGDAGAKQSLIFDPTKNAGKGAILAKLTQVVSGDEVWVDPNNNTAYLTGVDTSGNRVLAIVDLTTNTWLQNLPTGPGAHSVAVDPISGEAFVPVGGFVPYPTPPGGWGTSPGSGAVCGDPLGCVLVFAPVPEPASLPLMLTALAGLTALAWRRRSRQS
jgi:hypothetical protein